MSLTIGHFMEHNENNRDEFVEFTFWGLASLARQPVDRAATSYFLG